MLTCAACGAENADGARFCSSCGSPLSASAPERRKLATLVFCDMSGSTAMGERVDPETVQGLMLSYFHEMRAALERHGGTVEKFIGDAVVAVFGVPEAHEDDALRACRAALEMQTRMASLNEELERRFGTRIALRIGVNSGEVVARDPSSRETFVTGDAVNVAARLEQAAEPGAVLIGEPTHRLVRDAVTVEPVEPLAAKGKSEPVAAYRLLSVSGRGPVPRRAGTPLVGRDDELELLEQEFDAAAAERRCRLVTVVGEPGVGKSRLAAEVLTRIGPRARAVRGGCLSYGEGITYWAIRQIVRDLAGIRDEHSPERARSRLDGLLADAPDGRVVAAQIAQLVGIGEATNTTAEEMAWSIRQLLAASARGRPLLVLVDDIHWAEPALLELLAGLPARIREAPMLVVCLARPELLELAPDWEVTVRLEPLGGAALARLLSSLGAPEPVRAQLARASAGNPLFAEELVAMLVDEGVLREEGGTRVLDRGLEEVALPASLSALLGARLDRLDAQARDALERGAIEGELFHRGAVVELSAPESRPEVHGRLEALAERDFVHPAPAAFADEAAFRFKHILVREAAYRATAKKLRAALHEAFANWLERLVRDRLNEYEEVLGYHLEQSHRYRTELGPADDVTRALGERAAGHLGNGARRAAARGDYHAAAGLLERALACGFGDRSRRAHAQLERTSYLAYEGRYSEQTALAGEVLETAIHAGDRGLAARARVRRATALLWTANRDEAALREIAEEAIATLTELDDQRGLGEAYQFYGQAGAARETGTWNSVFYERALAAAEAAGDGDRSRNVIGSIALGLWEDPTPAGNGIRRCDELIRSHPNDRALEAILTRCMAALVAMAGRAEEALELVERSGRVLDELDILGPSVVMRVVAAEAREYAGDRAGAVEELTAKWERLEQIRPGAADTRAIRAAYRLAMLHCDAGRWDDAERCVAYGADAYARGELWPLRHVVQARLASHDGRHGEAIALARTAVELPGRPLDRPNLWGRTWEAVAEVQRAAGDDAAAGAAVAKALEEYEQKGNVAAATALRVPT